MITGLTVGLSNIQICSAAARTRASQRTLARGVEQGVNPPFGRLETRLPLDGRLTSSGQTVDRALTSAPCSIRIFAASA